jgi:signal transduction histidine kinase
MGKICLALLLIILVISALALNAFAGEKSSSVPDTEFISLDFDPETLPYRDVINFKKDDLIYPIYLDGIGRYSIQNSWRAQEILSTILFRKYPWQSENNLGQHNLQDVDLIHNGFPINYDNDSMQELAILYPHNDSLFVEIIDPPNILLYKRYIIHGPDSNHNGVWDHQAYFITDRDFNNDGNDELLLCCNTGYDQYPRCLLCLDLKNDSLLWQFNVPNNISHFASYIVERIGKSGPLTMLCTSALQNGARIDSLDDSHSYLFCIDANGKMLWYHETGNDFSSAYSTLVDLQDDGIPEILANYTYSNEDKKIDSAGLLVLDIEGNILDTIFRNKAKVLSMSTLFTDENKDREIWVTFSDGIWHVYTPQMNLIKDYQFDRSLLIRAFKDVLKTGNEQIITTDNSQTWLFDLNLNPLAHVPASLSKYDFMETDNESYDLLMRDNEKTYSFSFKKNPWYYIFFRQPQLAAIGGSLPFALIIVILAFYFVRTRAKNRIITESRDNLNIALRDLKVAQDKLIAAEKFKQAKDIAGGVAHEIHNALYPSMHALEKLLQRLNSIRNEDAHRNLRLLDLIKKSIERASKMTELVTRFTKLESEKESEPIELLPVINEVVDSNRERLESLNIALDIDCSDNLNIRSSRIHLYSLINNLLINAIDALDSTKDKKISIKAESNNGKTEMRIKDNGVGISEDEKSRIFDAFYSTKPNSGVGLGLSIVKKIVDLYDGKIEVKSKLDNGTEFIIFLPSV